MLDTRIAYFDELPDRQLVGQLLANDEETVEYVFFHRCNGMFAHIVNSLFHSQCEKEELITEFYLYLRENDWDSLRKFQFRSSLNTWMTVVALNYFKKIRKIQTKTVAEDPLLIEERQKDMEDDFDIQYELNRLDLYKAINRLSKPREQMALLAWLTGKSAVEIAEELGCTVMAVYNLIKKAKIELRTLLKDKEL